MSSAGLLSVEWEITDQNLPMPHIVATACAAFVEEVERRGLVLRSGPSPSVQHALRLLGNGVVPQQGAAAIYQLTRIAIEEAA